MIRAYDEYGNIVDLVEWEKHIRETAIDDFVKLAKEHEFKYGKKDISNCVIGFIEFFAEQLKEGASDGTDNQQ